MGEVVVKVIYLFMFVFIWASQWLSGKESTYNAGTTKDVGSIPGSGRFLEQGMDTHSSIIA